MNLIYCKQQTFIFIEQNRSNLKRGNEMERVKQPQLNESSLLVDY